MSFDAIVVGSGFGGSVCGARLAQRGMRVLVLERGPWWGPLQSGRPERDRRELPRGVLGIRKLLRNVRFARRGRRFERVFHTDGLLELHRFDYLTVMTGSGVGGGSHVYAGILEEPPGEFFDSFPPEITSETMRPYFDRVREVLRPVPLAELPEKDRAFVEASRAAGLSGTEYVAVAFAQGKNPDQPERVINSAGVEQFSSTWRSDVFVGCEDGSKTTLDLTYLALALQHGAEVRPACEVLAIEPSDEGYAVTYRDHRDRAMRREPARRLILAAGGLNTQRLLFDARDAHRTLPNLPATLGQHFSANGDYAALLWRTSVLKDSSRGPPTGALSRVNQGGLHRYVLGAIGLPVQALPVGGFLARWLRRSTLLFGMGRDASSGMIGFDGTGLTTSVGRSLDPALYDEIEQAVTRIAREYRPRRLFASLLASGDNGLFSVHPLGGCSMGTSAEAGFTDHRGEVFGHPGLFVADGSLYPRSPGIAPSMTIAALAERQASLMP